MPIFNYLCINNNCKTHIFEEYRHTPHNADVSECPDCGIQATRTYEGQSMTSRRGKIKSYRNGDIVWEDIDQVPVNQSLNTEFKGKEIDKTKIEIS